MKNIASLEHTGERWNPAHNSDTAAHIQHLSRYGWAIQYAGRKRVLDCACGSGFGTLLLSHVAEIALGVDVDMDVIHAAQEDFGSAKLEYACEDACETELPDSSFDLIVGFETIEHLERYPRYLIEMKRILAPGGLFLVSTPDKAIRKGGPIGGWHKQEWGYDEFVELCSSYFSVSQWFWQQWTGEIRAGRSASGDTFIIGALRK